jgi:hypothetical protein
VIKTAIFFLSTGKYYTEGGSGMKELANVSIVHPRDSSSNLSRDRNFLFILI